MARGERRLTDEQRRGWLRLIRSGNAGPATFRPLINQFGFARVAFAALPPPGRRAAHHHRLRD